VRTNTVDCWGSRERESRVDGYLERALSASPRGTDESVRLQMVLARDSRLGARDSPAHVPSAMVQSISLIFRRGCGFGVGNRPGAALNLAGCVGSRQLRDGSARGQRVAYFKGSRTTKVSGSGIGESDKVWRFQRMGLKDGTRPAKFGNKRGRAGKTALRKGKTSGLRTTIL